MAHLTIPVSDSMSAEQREALTKWFTMQAAEAGPDFKFPMQDDPEWQAETTLDIQRALEQAERGEVYSSEEAKRILDQKYGVERP